MPDLVLLTESYPFGGIGEPGFITPEIDFLANEFNRVIIAPVLDFGFQETLPSNVFVTRIFLDRPGAFHKLRTLFHLRTYRGLLYDSCRIKSISALRAYFAFTAYTLHYKAKIEALIKYFNLNLENTLFYTFWFDYATASLSLIPRARFVTRAHGQDIYEGTPPYISGYWRRESLDKMLRCFPVSEFAAEYMRELYPKYQNKIAARYLGTPSAAAVPPQESSANAVSIYSCSRVAPEKRVLFEYDVLREYALNHPEITVSWTHIGDGPLMPELAKSISTAPSNLSIDLIGTVSNMQVHKILASHHFDLMLHFSITEGFGLSVCEAMSYSIPALVTDIQALPEVIGPSGFTLPHNSSVKEAEKILEKALSEAHSLRPMALNEWKKRFNAINLRQTFAEELSELISNRS